MSAQTVNGTLSNGMSNFHGKIGFYWKSSFSRTHKYVCLYKSKIGAHTECLPFHFLLFFQILNQKKNTANTNKMTNKYSMPKCLCRKRKKIGGHQSTEISTLMIEPTKYTIKMDYLDPDWFFIQIIKARVTFCPTHKRLIHFNKCKSHSTFFSLSVRANCLLRIYIECF